MSSFFTLNKITADNNKLIERVAFCSVICAGFAFAGYSFVARKRCKKPDDNNFSQQNSTKSHRTRSTQTDDWNRVQPLLDERCVSPKSVRERVTDLNLTARLRKSSIPVSPEVRQALHQTGPWSTPLGCAKFLSVSAENISARPLSAHCKTLAASHTSLNVHPRSKSPESPQEDSVMMRTLGNLQKSPSSLTSFQVCSLSGLLRSTSEDVLLKTLSTVSNCAAFTINQDLLCDSDCPKLLKDLLLHPSEAVKISATQAIANIAVREKSYKCFQAHVTILLHNAVNGRELLKSLSLTALANLALDSSSHRAILKQVHAVTVMARTGTPVVQLQALRLLVNLSCNREAIPVLLLTEIPPDILETVLQTEERELILRLLTFLANIACYAAKFVDGSTRPTLLSMLYNLSNKRTDLHTLEFLAKDTDENVSLQAKRLHSALTGSS